MQMFKRVVQLHQDNLKNHPFFDVIESSQSVEPIARMARAISWWPMVFQDVLRLNLEQVADTEFVGTVKSHRDEDAGHDRWFLDDLRALEIEVPDMEELFGTSFQPIRDACYALIAEVHGTRSSAQRMALLLALESTGHIFFEKVADTVERVCPQLSLRYLSHFHLGVEKDHDLFAEVTGAALDKIVLPEADRAACEQMLSRVYDAFSLMFSYLAESAQEGRRNVSHVRGLAADSGEWKAARGF
jgi:hypothetical protein